MLRPPAFLLLLAAHQAAAIDVIAHRGYSCPELENTARSVQQAWRAGADAVELDVRVSSDGVVYLFHDEEIRGRKVSGMPYADVSCLSDRPIDTLNDVFDAQDAEGYFVLDLKSGGIDAVDRILDVVRSSQQPLNSISFQSENLDDLEHIRSALTDVTLTYLSHLKWKLPYVVHPGATQLVRKLDGHAVNRISIKGRSFVDKEFVSAIKTSGREVHVWTINDPGRAAHYVELGVDGLITDRVESIIDGQAQSDGCQVEVAGAH